MCCVDIDECDMFNNLCVNGQCENVMGYFECSCAPGYKLDSTAGNCTGMTRHTDVDYYVYNANLSVCLSVTVLVAVCTVLLYCVSKKQPACNFKKDECILTIFGTNIPGTTGHQMATQFPTSPSICVYTTWENRTNEILHFIQGGPIKTVHF